MLFRVPFLFVFVTRSRLVEILEDGDGLDKCWALRVGFEECRDCSEGLDGLVLCRFLSAHFLSTVRKN